MSDAAPKFDYVRELIGTACRCGAPKKTRMTFCTRCYFALPKRMRDNLYRDVGSGYEQAYDAAAKLLDEKKTTA